MTPVWEVGRLMDYLYDVLEPDATLRTALGGAGRVYRSVPQATTALPAAPKYVTLTPLSQPPIVCLGPVRRGRDVTVSIRVWGKDRPFSNLTDALDRLEALLFGLDVQATIQGGAWRITHYEREDTGLAPDLEEVTPGGVVYRHSGHLWPFYIREAA